MAIRKEMVVWRRKKSQASIVTGGGGLWRGDQVGGIALGCRPVGTGRGTLIIVLGVGITCMSGESESVSQLHRR